MAEIINAAFIAATLMIATEGNLDGPQGTGFLVVRPDVYNYANPEEHNWEGATTEEDWRIWYVTCVHVVDDIEANGGRAQIRMNEEGTNSGITKIGMPTTYWTRHPNWKPLWKEGNRRKYTIEDVDNDVAVAIAPTHYEKWSELFQGAWPAHWQMTRELIKRYKLYEGNRVFVTGFPTGGW